MEQTRIEGYLFSFEEIIVFREAIIRWQEEIAAALMKYMIKQTFLGKTDGGSNFCRNRGGQAAVSLFCDDGRLVREYEPRGVHRRRRKRGP